jgi:DNA polymerase III subunit delta
MAEKKAGATYEAVLKDLKARNFAPIYILMGDESYFIDKLADFIADNVLPPEERDFNQAVVFGADVTPAQVVDMARQYPVMPAQYNVIIVKEAQNLKSWDVVEKYLDHPMKSTILVFCYKNGTIDRRKKVVAKAETVGVVFESKKKKDYELPAFIKNYLKQHETVIDDKSAAMIAEHIGADLNRLVSELNKVLLSLPADNRVVTPDIVERQIGVSKDFNVFELRNAIVNRDVFKANQIVNYFDKNPKAGSVYSFLPMLFGFFQNLMIAYYAPARNDEKALAAFLEMKSVWAVKDYMVGMRNFTASKTLQIIFKMREIDAKSKGLDNPNTPPNELVKELLFFILH